MAYQVGQVQQQPILSPLEQDSRVAQADAQRMTLTSLYEQQKAKAQAAQQKQQQDAYLQEAVTRFKAPNGSPDWDAVIKDAYTRYPDLAMGLEKQLTEHRSKLIDGRKKELESEKLSMDIDVEILKRLTPESYASYLPRLSPELQQTLGPQFDPARTPAMIAELTQKGPTEAQRLEKLRLLLDKDTRRAMLEELATAPDPEEVWVGWTELFGPKDTAAMRQRVGDISKPEGKARLQSLLVDPAQQALQADRVADNARQDAQLKISQGQLDVARGNLQVRRQEANKPTAEGGSGGAKLSAGAIEKVAGVDQSIGMLDDIDRLMPNMAGFIGPLDGRAAKARLATGAGVTSELAEFDAQLTGLKNAVIKATTGAAMSEPEAKRIMGQLPDLSLPEEVFKARLATTRKNLELLKKRTIELSGGTVAPTSKEAPKKLSAAELIKKYGGG